MHILVSELQRDVMRRHAEPECPAIDVERRDRRIPRLVDAGADTRWIGVDHASGEGEIPESGRHEDVRRRRTIEQTPANLRPIDQRVLRRRGLVIDAAHVDARAAPYWRRPVTPAPA